MANGIDVYSQYQKVSNWNSVRSAGTDFVYIKLSDGTATRNEAGYTAGAKAAGLKVGGYHYAEPGDPVAQANLFINLCEQHGATDLAPALDLEAPFTPNQAAINFAIAFLRQVKARGHQPCLYGNNAMLSAVRAPVLAAVPGTLIWAARYGANPTVGYDFWQWSDAGKVPGISASSVDLNKGNIPFNLQELLTMELTDKVNYKNRNGGTTTITVHDVLARVSLMFDDLQWGAAGQRTDGPIAHMQRAQMTAQGIAIPESVK